MFLLVKQISTEHLFGVISMEVLVWSWFALSIIGAIYVSRVYLGTGIYGTTLLIVNPFRFIMELVELKVFLF
jgi:hypothetical protein